MSQALDPAPLGPPLRILMVSSEVGGFARTGGLGDVVSGLASALASLGCDVAVVTPRYGVSEVPEPASWWPDTVSARIGWGADDVRTLGVLSTTLTTPALDGGARSTVRVFLLDHPDLFARAGVYGDVHGTFGDNDTRFVAMSRGALAVAERLWPAAARVRGGPDVLHAHDWHAAPAVISAKLTMGAAWRDTPSLITIHNLAFQGVLGHDALDRLALPRAAFGDGTLAHDGQVNLLAGAVALADGVTTVSPTYASEILRPEEGCGLDALLRAQGARLTGIVNGIDAARFDPATDEALASRFDQGSLEGKLACKLALGTELGIDASGPLFASISRLTGQKGVDLLLSVLPGLVERGARFVLVGAGEAPLERALLAMANRFPTRVGARITFDGALARRVYAAADFVVVPSRYEPCGLTQLYAMRYGAVPVVTPVGGLRDTVTPLSAILEAGTGFVAASPTAAALLVACEDALMLYRDEQSLRAASRRCMERGSSWDGPAREYLALYASLRSRASA